MSDDEFKDLIDSSEKVVTYEKFSAMRKAREETKAYDTAELAKENQYPLKITVEEMT